MPKKTNPQIRIRIDRIKSLILEQLKEETLSGIELAQVIPGDVTQAIFELRDEDRITPKNRTRWTITTKA